ncbi:MAG: DUF3014 domain-containing protein [Deltaproteobacteria bacterium]
MAFALPAKSRGIWPWSLGLLAAGGIAVFVIHAMHEETAPAAVPPAVAASPAPATDVALPPAAESDARIRDALSGLTPNELFKRWLQQDHLLDTLVVSTVNIAEDQTPARQLSFLKPHRRFTATRSGGELVISPRSHARYDAFASVISSLDAKRVASAYRALHPLLESAYHALGYPDRPLDEVVTRALQRIEDAPVRDGVALRKSGSVYLFADERLEALGGVEKQLLRMGPKNTRLLQAEAREIGSALGLPLRGEPQATTAR